MKIFVCSEDAAFCVIYCFWRLFILLYNENVNEK